MANSARAKALTGILLETIRESENMLRAIRFAAVVEGIDVD
jgi:hypothetical protein